ncbi:hypothetical protein AVEN_151960-1 [Araneus ventricosus]|uniref:Uncharacterized protein n=1 Tax=Araneus ventricosus TaxID=182803 RepID=A0A4Y2FYX3_ARAVE|nr:hypothetical protein AVEN_151960-1 [Araneus ventricosus]
MAWSPNTPFTWSSPTVNAQFLDFTLSSRVNFGRESSTCGCGTQQVDSTQMCVQATRTTLQPKTHRSKFPHEASGRTIDPGAFSVQQAGIHGNGIEPLTTTEPPGSYTLAKKTNEKSKL